MTGRNSCNPIVDFLHACTATDIDHKVDDRGGCDSVALADDGAVGLHDRHDGPPFSIFAKAQRIWVARVRVPGCVPGAVKMA